MADHNGFVESTIEEFMPMATAMLDSVRSDIAGGFDMDDPTEVVLTSEEIRQAIRIQATILTPSGEDLAAVVANEPSLLFVETEEGFNSPETAIRAYLVKAITARIVALMADRLLLNESASFDLGAVLGACSNAIAVGRATIGDDLDEADMELEEAIAALPDHPDGMDVFRLMTPMMLMKDQLNAAQWTDDWPKVGPVLRKLGEAIQIVNSDCERIASNGWIRPIASRP